MVTIKQIAESAHVSMATVSRVLNQDETIIVSTEVRNKIFDITHELRYVPPKKRHMKIENGITIGIVDWHSIKKEIDSINLLASVSMANRYCKEYVEFKRMIYGERIAVDGIIVIGKLSTEEVIYLKQQSYSILFIDSDRQDYQYDRIIIDYEEGFMQMANYILETKRHESFGYIGGCESPETIIGMTTNEPLVKALKDKGIYQEDLFFSGELSKKSGYELAQKAIRTNRLAKAILLENDQVAEGVFEALAENQIQVPEDLEVIIYKAIEAPNSKFTEYKAIQKFPHFVWETAIKLLFERITGTRSETMTVILPSKFCAGT